MQIVDEHREKTAVDKLLLWSVLVLAAFGIVAVYSAVSFLAATKSGGNTERFLFLHLGRVSLGLAVMGVFSLIDYHKVARFGQVALIVAIALLLSVQVIGVVSGGAARWLRVAGVGFQPSDLAKVALLLYVAVLLARKQTYIQSLSRAYAPILVWILITIMAIGIEDLSTAAVVLSAVVAMCFIARVRVLHLVTTCLVGLALGYALLLASPQRAARLESFVGKTLFPSSDSEAVLSDREEGYQASQAKIAFAMGGISGVGPGKSVQRDFLPAPYNDFIYAIIAEEYGIIGALLLLGVYVVVLFRGLLRIARRAPDPLGLFLATGLVMMIALYGFVHAGVAAGLFPVTGLPLPFVSYGGTSLLTSGLMMGILLNISRQVC
jgi:cell division protein FtsW